MEAQQSEIFFNLLDFLKSTLRSVGMNIPRFRFSILMENAIPKTKEEYYNRIHIYKVEQTIEYLQNGAFDTWENSDDKTHPSFIYKNVIESYDGTPTRKIVDIDFSKIHGKKRKILKKRFKDFKKIVTMDYEMWNAYCRKNVLMIDAKIGSHIREYFHFDNIKKYPGYLGDSISSFDNNHCYIYFDINKLPKEVKDVVELMRMESSKYLDLNKIM